MNEEIDEMTVVPMPKDMEDEIDAMRIEKEIKEMAAEAKALEAASNNYIDITNPITREIHQLLNDDRYDLHEINKDNKHLDAGWAGYISDPLAKDTFRALVEGFGICQIIKGQIRSVMKPDEFIFVKRIGGRSVF